MSFDDIPDDANPSYPCGGSCPGSIKNIADIWQCNTCTVSKASVDDEYKAALLQRVRAASKRIADNDCIRQIPANPCDPDLVLTEVEYFLSGRPIPFWIKDLMPKEPT